jgi:predicted RNA-binding Zn ribbon-like protein
VGFDFFAGDLSLDFVNTLDPHAESVPERDQLKSYRDLVDWAAQAGVLSAPERAVRLRLARENPQAAETAFSQAIELRGSLHHLVLALLERRSPVPDDLCRFNVYLSNAQAHLQLDTTPEGYRLRLVSDPQLGSLLWPIASAAGRLLTSEEARLIRRCDAESCRGLFVDRSKNHSRRWCDMKVCGNRAKARQHYLQQKQNR